MASSVTKKNSLCRYYVRYGDCFHGENCQFIHAFPPQSSPQPQPTPIEAPQPQTPASIPQSQSIASGQPQQQPQQQQLQQQQLQQQQQQQQQQQVPQQQGYNLNKLICSFKSDLPNEIDFAMQVATLLANTDNFTWYKDYPLVDAICSSLHVFVCICGDISTCYCYPRFWHKLLIKNACNQHLQAATLPPDMKQSFLNFEALKNHDLKDQSKIYRRIKTAAELTKQFSMTTGISKNEKNDQTNFDYLQIKKKKLKASPSLLKFVSLLLHCDDTPLNLIGLDILSNTASKLAKIPDATDDPTCAKLVQMFQDYCFDSISRQDGDIYIVNRSIEVISKLISSSSRRVSVSLINQITEKDLVFRMEQFLTSHYDVTLFLSALECCYRISRHQPHLLASSRTRHLMKILVNLLNCEDDRYFTPAALKRIKLIDEFQPNQQQPELQPTSIPLAKLQQPQITKPPQPRPPQMQQTPQTPQAPQPPKLQPQPQPQIVQQPKRDLDPTKEHICEWDNCNSQFSEAKQLYTHVFEAHIGPLAADCMSPCLWSGPNGSGPGCLTKRPKFSLLTHLNDFHCNPAGSRSQPVKPPEHPGYAPNAALLAIKRHANAHSGLKSTLQNQSPLSISVRLTAALILRNLATESTEVKQALENYEPLLCEICMTNGRDESKIIAECLNLFCSE